MGGGGSIPKLQGSYHPSCQSNVVLGLETPTPPSINFIKNTRKVICTFINAHHMWCTMDRVHSTLDEGLYGETSGNTSSESELPEFWDPIQVGNRAVCKQNFVWEEVDLST